MSLKLAVSLGALQTGVSLVLSFLSIKVTSVYLGPAGIATLGQLIYFIALLQGALSGFHTGIVRRVAQLSGRPDQTATVIATVARMLFFVGLPAAVVIAMGSGWVARELLHDSTLSPSVLLFACVFVFGLWATVINACASGAKDYRTVAMANIAGAAISCALTVTLSLSLGVLGGLLALAILPGTSLLIAWLLARRKAWWPVRPLSHGFSSGEARGLLAFLPLGVINSVGVPLLHLVIRDNVASQSGMAAVGYLQGVSRISDIYLGVATSVILMYFFPRFSELRDPSKLATELKKCLIAVVPAVSACSLLIYLTRDWIIALVFTSEFNAMSELFGWQMVGNTLRVAGSLFFYLLLSQGHAFAMAALDAATMVVWWGFSAYLIPMHGALGATEAYAATSALYAGIAPILTITFLWKRRKSMEGPAE